MDDIIITVDDENGVEVLRNLLQKQFHNKDLKNCGIFWVLRWLVLRGIFWVLRGPNTLIDPKFKIVC